MADDKKTEIWQEILINPITSRPDRLCILSAHATPSMVSWLLKTYEERKIEGISIELIIISTPEESISRIDHEGYLALHKAYRTKAQNTFSCSYLHQTCCITENLYIWANGDTPVKAFICSCDFTQGSFLRNRDGRVSEYRAMDAYKTYELVSGNSSYCDFAEIEDYVIIGASNLPKVSELPPDDPNCISLSLVVKRTGEPGVKSGLNWGQRSGRNPNEAYIPLPREIAKSGFFPLEKQHFLVVTDDHHTLQLRVEQQNDKAITTPSSNAQLGEYFRNRLRLANGSYVRTSDLDAYGRRDVSFYKIDDEQYYMDFSVVR
jgi:hypothetical protein